MKIDIILAGVGGQGILSIAAVLGAAALENNLNIKQAETHGMSQRGGAVVSHLRISDAPIASDLIPLGEADLILAVEPMEALRYLPFLKKDGCVVTNRAAFVNIPNYPAHEEILEEIKKLKHNQIVDADQIAKDAGNAKASNMAMIGAAAPYISMSYESIEKGIRSIFKSKGEDVIALNLNVLAKGREFALSEK